MYENNHYNKDLKEYARKLRTESISKAERYLWKSLLKQRKMDVPFKRQRPIDRYIVDFLSSEVNLIIEVDGSSHINKSESDKSRQDRLEALGFQILRFSEKEVLNNINEVHAKIAHAIHALRIESQEESSPAVPPEGSGQALQRGKLVEEPQQTYRRGSGLITV